MSGRVVVSPAHAGRRLEELVGHRALESGLQSQRYVEVGGAGPRRRSDRLARDRALSCRTFARRALSCRAVVGPARDRRARVRVRAQVALLTVMVGNLALKSLARAAMLTATRRATCLYSAAISPSGSATTVGRPLSACSRIFIVSGSAPR